MLLGWGSAGASSFSNFQIKALLEALLLCIINKIEGEKNGYTKLKMRVNDERKLRIKVFY